MFATKGRSKATLVVVSLFAIGFLTFYLLLVHDVWGGHSSDCDDTLLSEGPVSDYVTTQGSREVSRSNTYQCYTCGEYNQRIQYQTVYWSWYVTAYFETWEICGDYNIWQINTLLNTSYGGYFYVDVPCPSNCLSAG